MTQKGTIRMSGRTARTLSVAVVTLLCGSYLLEFLGPEMPRYLERAVGVVKIGSLLGAIFLFLGTHGQRAQSPDAMLDERERSERDRSERDWAFVRTHQFMIGGLLSGCIYFELAGKLGFWTPDIGQVLELMTIFTLLSMALPGMILAFRDRAAEEE